MKSEPLSLFLSFYLFVSGFSEQEKQQDRIAPPLSASRAATHMHEYTNTHSHTQARQESVCGGPVGVNLHVNEMALSALVSNSKSVRAKDAIFVYMCVLMFS